MEYNEFLIMMSQLSFHKKARVVLQGSVYFIEATPNKNKWRLSTKLLFNQKTMPTQLGECISPHGVLRWDHGGAYLKFDYTESDLYLVREIECAAKYVPFRYLVSDFIDVADEWKAILDDFSKKDHTSIRR